MTGRPCDLCDRASGDDARVCTTCTSRATAALHEIADWLAEALDDAVGRRTALGPTAGAGSTPTRASEAPMPIDLTAVEAADVLRSTLVGWIRVAREDGATALPEDTIAAMARWLIPTMRWARGREYGPEMVDEILTAAHQALRAIDIPVRYVPLHTTCRHITLEEQTPRACGEQLRAVVAPGLAIDGQVRCASGEREHTTTVLAEERARARARRVRTRLART